jgi:hypothetical protein
MLEQMPEYQRLSDEEKMKIVRRLVKIEAHYRHPERPQKMREELRKIVDELRQKK